MESTHRLYSLKVYTGFRTVSNDAALVISEIIPIELLAVEAKEIHEEAEKLGRRCTPSQ